MRFIICNGMRRSGSTLQYNLIVSMLKHTKVGVGGKRGTGGFGGGWVGSKQLMQAILDYKDESKPLLLKTHDHWLVEKVMKFGAVKLCYTYRDLRDVWVSFRRIMKLGDKDAIGMLETELRVFTWIRKRQCGVLMHRYEDMVNDLHGTVRELGAWLDLPLTEDIIQRVLEDNTLEKARAVAAKTTKNKDGEFDRTTLMHYGHISEGGGKPGAWRNELTAGLAMEIYNKFREWFESRGYPRE
jgi:hypothetical protein